MGETAYFDDAFKGKILNKIIIGSVFPMKPHVCPMIGWMVGQSVGWFVCFENCKYI